MNERAFVIGVLAVFAAMAAAVALRSYAEAAFLHQYGARWLPYLLVSQAVAFAAGATLYDVATARASLPWVDTALTVGLTGAALAAPALVARGGSWPFAVALVVISISQVVGLAVWNAICASVGGRDARRWLPRAGAAATAGGAVAGLGAGLLIPRLGADVVPYVAGGLAAAVPVLVALLRRELGRGGAPGAATPAGQSASAISDDHRRVLRWLAAAAVLEAAVATSIEFSFGASMKARYHGADLATAVALFYGGTNALLLLLQITLVPRLLVTQRQPFTVSVHPITVVVGLGGLLALPGFAVLAVLRTVEHVLRAATSRTGQEISLSPLPPVARARWKVLLRGAATPLGAALASAALIAAGAAALAEPRAVAAVTAAVGLIWLGAARGSARAFVAALAAPLGMKRVAQARRAEGLDLEQLHRLVTAAGADDPQVARLARAELTRVGGGADEITAHLDHDEPRVRAALYALAARRPSPQARAELRAAAAIEDDDDALPAAIEALAAHGDGEAIARLGERATLDPAAARAVRAGLAQVGRGDADAARAAFAELAATDGEWAARLARARADAIDEAAADVAIGRALAAGGEARRQGLRAAAAAGGPAAIRALLDGLVVDDADAHGAIAGLGVDDAAHLGGRIAQLADDDRDRDDAALAHAALARALIGATGATPLLERLAADERDAEVREAALRSLVGAARAGHAPAAAMAAQAVTRERAAFAALLAARRPDGARPALHAAELARATRRGLRRLLLAAALDAAAAGGDPAPLAAAERRLSSRSEPTRRRALDVLQEIVRSRPGLIDLVERWLRPPAAIGDADADAALAALAPHDPWLADLLRGAHAAGEARLAALRACPFFDELAGHDAAALAAEADEVAIDAGAVVMTAGEPGDAMYVVLAGDLAVEADGAEVARLGAGGVVGELAAIDDAPRAATVRAVTPARLLAIRRARFAAALDRWPDLGTGLLRTLAARLRRPAVPVSSR